MGTLYKDARLKANRAKKHIRCLEAAIFEMEETYSSTIEHHPDTNAQTLKHEIPGVEDAFDRLSLIVGDVIHNLHCALDYAWYSTINRLLPDKVSDSTKFPVRKTREGVESALRGIEVDTRCERLFDCIMSDIQPYKGGHNEAIWTLHDLDIMDKHLVLLEFVPNAQIRGTVIRHESGEIFTGDTWAIQDCGPYRIDFAGGIEIKNKGKLSVAISFKEAGIWKGVSVLNLLQSFSNFIPYVIKLLEDI
ncbi:MAG: hypothetical protein WB007_00855 [Candidatus Acidiferrales bacterium]